MQVLCLELGEDDRHIQWMNIHWSIGRPQKKKKNFLHDMAKVKKEPIDGVTQALSQALVFFYQLS